MRAGAPAKWPLMAVKLKGAIAAQKPCNTTGESLPEALAVNVAVITRVTFSYYSSYSHSHSLSLKVTACHSKSVCHSKSLSEAFMFSNIKRVLSTLRSSVNIKKSFQH